MDNECVTQFHRKFDEQEIDRRRNLVLGDVNLYLYRKCPSLVNASPVVVSKSSRSLKDVLKPKRSALGQGFVEVEMMLKLNKHLFLSNPEQVKQLPAATWKEFIPKRPAFPGDNDDEESTASNNDPADDAAADSEPEEFDEVIDIDNDEDARLQEWQQQPQPQQQQGKEEQRLIESDNNGDGLIVPDTPGDTLTSMIVTFDSQETCDMY